MLNNERIASLQAEVKALEAELARHSRIHSVYDDHVPTHQILESLALRLSALEEVVAALARKLAEPPKECSDE